ncbi:hypothetical protein [Streptomyces sp. NPDC056061]|uniref:hypothetical protein n=1 Tax=Streptomyces sp. NPDC056061 TaxID=3345700 RepID=UPI0035E19E2F
MNTFLNVLGMSAFIILSLLPALLGLARERRISRELLAAQHMRNDAPPETAGAARPVTAERRPYIRSWARI